MDTAVVTRTELNKKENNTNSRTLMNCNFKKANWGKYEKETNKMF